MDWLNDTERQAWIGLLACAAGMQYTCDRRLQADAGISFRTYSVLAAVSDQSSGPVHMSGLSGITGHSPSRLSHAITRLERDGLVARSECPSDRRAVHVQLTDHGTDVLERAAPAHVRAVRELIFDRLTPAQSAALADATLSIWQSLVTTGEVPQISVLAQTEIP